MVGPAEKCFRDHLGRFRKSFFASANRGGSLGERRDFRNLRERELSPHRGRQAPEEVEGALVLQIAKASAAARLLRAYAAQIETLPD
jgi:hypothetical protein